MYVEWSIVYHNDKEAESKIIFPVALWIYYYTLEVENKKKSKYYNVLTIQVLCGSETWIGETKNISKIDEIKMVFLRTLPGRMIVLEIIISEVK